uniref:Uncharacterized protein n=1 Tax=candidate division WOR-3 bacterium TaxID=2052148 RepID=A0A7V1EH11_UNCW3
MSTHQYRNNIAGIVWQFLYLTGIFMFLLVQPVQAAVTILEDFEDGDTISPYLWRVIKTDSCIASFIADSGSGYQSIYAGYGNYTILRNKNWCVFVGLNFFGSFLGDGIIFYAKGNGIWNINLITADINPNDDPMPFVKVVFDTLWKAYYILWDEFCYPAHAKNRPEIIPSHIYTIYISSKSAKRTERAILY